MTGSAEKLEVITAKYFYEENFQDFTFTLDGSLMNKDSNGCPVRLFFFVAFPQNETLQRIHQLVKAMLHLTVK